MSNDGSQDSLELRYVYHVVADSIGSSGHFERSVDASEENDLYPADVIVPIHLTHAAQAALTRASGKQVGLLFLRDRKIAVQENIRDARPTA